MIAALFDATLTRDQVRKPPPPLRFRAPDRTLTLRHNRYRGIPLSPGSRDAVLKHVRKLWGYDVTIEEPEG